jgi:CheY-like chemotaxis protein
MLLGRVSLSFAGTANANIHWMKTILLADDDASVRESITKVLKSAGYEVVLAAGGLEAIARFEGQSIDLVLLDLGLPNLNGWEVCRHFTHERPRVPVVAITGQSGQYPSALAAGASALMEKPLDAHRVLHIIQELLDKPTASDSLRPSGIFYHVGP